MIQPKHGYFRRNGDRAEIGCNSSDEKWTLKCEGSKWVGKYKNCSSNEMIQSGEGPLPKSIFPSGTLYHSQNINNLIMSIIDVVNLY